MPISMRLLGREHFLEVKSCGQEPALRIDGITYQARLERQRGSSKTLCINGQEMQFHAVEDASGVHIRWRGRTYQVQTPDSADLRKGGSQQGNQIVAEMPGTVVRIHKEEGDSVAAGDVVITIESMKLLMNLSAPCSGKISTIPMLLNKVFEKGVILAIIDSDEESS